MVSESLILDTPTPNKAAAPVEWKISPHLIAYPDALAEMESRAAAIAEASAAEMVWLLEHPPIYTAGTSAKEQDLLDPRFPVFHTGRGGQFTYHGPGQRIGYVMLNLKRRKPDVRAYVHDLEEWLIETLKEFDVKGERREGRVGIWVRRGSHEDKIAALGVRIKRWISLHGVALNVDPNLEHFSGIVPCGVTGHGVTSLAKLGIAAKMSDIDLALKKSFEKIFG